MQNHEDSFLHQQDHVVSRCHYSVMHFTTPTTATLSSGAAAPHLREDLLSPRFYTTQIAKAAR